MQGLGFHSQKDHELLWHLVIRQLTKGWDIFEKMNIPDGWVVVANASRNHYNKENISLRFNNKQSQSLIDLQGDFITEEDLIVSIIWSQTL